MDRKRTPMNYYAPGGLAPAGAVPMHSDKPNPTAGLYATPAAFAHTSPYTANPSALGLGPQRSYPGAGMSQYAMASVPSHYTSTGGFQPLTSTAYPTISQGGGFYTVPSVYQTAVPTMASTSPGYPASQYATSPYQAHAGPMGVASNSPAAYTGPLPASSALYAATGYPGFSSAPTRSYSQVAPLPYASPQPPSNPYPGASTFGPPY